MIDQSYLDDITTAIHMTGNELKQRALISTACQSLKFALNCKVAQIVFVNCQRGVLQFYSGGAGKKSRVPFAQCGITGFLASEGTTVNVAVASEQSGLSKIR